MNVLRSTFLVFGGVLLIAGNQVLAENSINEALSLQNKQLLSSQASQSRIDKLSVQTKKLLDEYKQTLYQIDNLKAYNAHLEKLVSSQKTESLTISRQLGEIGTTQQNISPLVIRMVNTLDDFVKIDIPFHQSERQIRIDALKEMLNRADISVSEKYRRVMEAYQIEVGYGKTLSSYQGKLTISGNMRTVEFLRIGRVGFYYRTLDGDSQGYWDIHAKTWKDLPSEYDDYINKGFKVAMKHQAPDLLMVPVQYTKAVP